MGLQNRADHPVAMKDAERLPKVGDLEVDVHDRFQRREWRVQRIGWTVLESLDDVEYAVVERNGAVSVVPREGATP